MAQLDVRLTGDEEVMGVRQQSFVEIEHEISSMVILALLLIQEEQLSLPDERMSTSEPLGGLSLLAKMCG